MEAVGHDGRTTAYRRVDGDGGGSTVLYVHGSGGTHRAWANQYVASGPSHPAVAVDLSGHGESDDIDTEPGEDTLAAYAADVVAVAETVGADVLVGASLGGAIAQRIVLDADWQPAALVLAGTGPKLPVYEGLREWLATDFERALEFLHGRDRLYHDADQSLLDRSKREMHAVGRRVTRRDFLTSHAFDVTDRLGAIDVPTLAVCGEHDKLTPREYHEQLAQGIPKGEFAVVPDSAHLAMLEQPKLFNETVASFLDSRLSE